MSRVARIVIPHIPHHIVQRGNRRCDVFLSDGDREFYIGLLRRYSVKHEVQIWAYCLMTNHIHLVAVPGAAPALGRMMAGIHTVHALRFNEQSGQSGHLWQGRFRSAPMDEAHAWAAVRYVELNPVRAGLAARAEEYAWSSAAGHCGLGEDGILAADFPPKGVVEDWAEWLNQPAAEEEARFDRIRSQTKAGKPCGLIERVTKGE